MNLVDSFEKIPVEIFPSAKSGSQRVANEIAALIRQRQQNGASCVLGAGNRLYPYQPVCRTGAHAQGRRIKLSKRDHLQPR